MKSLVCHLVLNGDITIQNYSCCILSVCQPQICLFSDFVSFFIYFCFVLINPPPQKAHWFLFINGPNCRQLPVPDLSYLANHKTKAMPHTCMLKTDRVKKEVLFELLCNTQKQYQTVMSVRFACSILPSVFSLWLFPRAEVDESLLLTFLLWFLNKRGFIILWVACSFGWK